MSDTNPEHVVERMTDPDPFDLARRVKTHVECTCRSADRQSDVTYLWIYVSKLGMGQCDDSPCNEIPTLEQWLNVVDEAAGTGVTSLVVSINAPLNRFPDVWEVCRWAQDSHNMTVGIHVFVDSLEAEAIAAIDTLDARRTKVFGSESVVQNLKSLEAKGLQIHLAEPSHNPGEGNCTLPSRMVFVNPEGTLYTCGMVEGNDAYRLGTIFEGSFARIVQDGALPHVVPGTDATNPRGCDGCPPMLSRYFEGQ